jgi:tetratricopeptide (TPR) repeat protein
MQDSPALLAKKAIEASLQGNWKEAIELNLALLDRNPKDLDAKNRLGRAYLQLKEFNKAKKVFKEVLSVDPINAVALKNLKLASEERVEHNGKSPVNPKNLIKEPGTTIEITLEIVAKRVTAESFTPAEHLAIRVNPHQVDFYKKDSHGSDMLVASITSDLVRKFNMILEREETVEAYFVNGNDKHIRVLIKSSIPVFRGERQEVKPYIKQGSFDEPELEIATEFEDQ